MGCVCTGNGQCPLHLPRGGEAVMHIARHEEPEPGVVVLAVVPAEEVTAEGAHVLDRAEAVGEVLAVLNCLELRRRERVVVRDVWSRVRLSGAEVCVEGELASRDPLPLVGLGDEPLGESHLSPLGDHPADDVVAEDVEDDVQREETPLHGTEELSDIPSLDLVRGSGEELRRGVPRVTALRVALTDLAVLGQDAVHREFGAEVAPFVEERGVDLGGCQVGEARRVEDIKDGAALLGLERAWGRGPCCRWQPQLEVPIVGRRRKPQRGTGRRDAEPGPESDDGLHDRSSPVCGSWMPRSSKTFGGNSTSALAVRRAS